MEQEIAEQYAKSSRCLFLLDYDGTLADFKKYPDEARLTRSRRETLQALCYHPRNTVVIISGRDRETLDEWLSDLPINLAAEYGHFIKEDGKPWEIQGDQNERWKYTVRPILEQLVTTVLGSYIEEKEFSLAWHYWDIDDEIAEKAIQAVQKELDAAVAEFHLLVTPAAKNLDVRVSGIDKSVIAKRWLARDTWDFVLAAGDDTADEVLFKALPNNVFTIKVGSGKSAARYRMSSPHALTKLLSHLNTID